MEQGCQNIVNEVRNQLSTSKIVTKASKRTVQAVETERAYHLVGALFPSRLPSSSCRTRIATHEFTGTSPACGFGFRTPFQVVRTRPTQTVPAGVWKRMTFPGLSTPENQRKQENLRKLMASTKCKMPEMPLQNGWNNPYND